MRLTSSARRARSGVRALDPARDFGAVARVIEIGFAEEMTPGAELVLRDLRLLARLRPLFWLLSPFFPYMGESFGGFVWEEEGRVVANTTVTRGNEVGSHWIISNVAVLPAFRRRGIARAMMEASLDYARERGGQYATLHVRSDNGAARALYERLGFSFVDSTTELFAPLVRAPALPVPPGASVGPPVAARWFEAYELARSAATVAAQSLRPIRPASYRFSERSMGDRARGAFGMPLRERLWGEVGGQLVALLTLDEQRGGRFGALVEVIEHPNARGQIEAALVNEIGARLRGRRDVRATVAAPLTELRAALAAAGFHELRTLDQMATPL